MPHGYVGRMHRIKVWEDVYTPTVVMATSRQVGKKPRLGDLSLSKVFLSKNETIFMRVSLSNYNFIFKII